MKLVTVFSNKLNKQRFFIILGWGISSLFNDDQYKRMACISIGPAIPIVAISAGVAHKYYGTSY